MLEMKVAICVPYRGDGARRDQLWARVEQWIHDHYDYPLYERDSGPGSFRRAQARNEAARAAGDWDVALFHDADTLAHPDAVAGAIQAAAISDQMVVAGDTYMYLTEGSTDRFLDDGLMFPRPISFDEHGCFPRPCSGVYAVSRTLWEATGGFVESMQGWGAEDLVFLTLCGIYGNGNAWVPDHTLLHLWHEPSPRTVDTHRNEAIWRRLDRYKTFFDKAGASQYLQSLGHLCRP